MNHLSDHLWVTLVVGALCLGGASFVLVSAVGMLRVRDGVSRVNVLSGATGLGMPMVVLGVLVHQTAQHGFSVVELVKALIAVTAFVILSSAASSALGRAAYRSGARLDPATNPNELAEEPRPERAPGA